MAHLVETFTADQREAIRAVAAELPAIWNFISSHHPKAITPKLRQDYLAIRGTSRSVDAVFNSLQHRQDAYSSAQEICAFKIANLYRSLLAALDNLEQSGELVDSRTKATLRHFLEPIDIIFPAENLFVLQ